MYIVDCGNLAINGNVTVIGPITNSQTVVQAGTTVAVTCPSGLILTGPNTSTCMESGEWEPDLREVECKGENS